MAIKRIEDFVAWQHARELERRVFAFTAKAPARGDLRFCDDIRRSSPSAPRNMAEGFGRFWPGEFAHKLHIALGELRETLDHLEKALESHYITDAEHLEMFGLGDGAIGAAVKFIEYLEAAGPDWKKAFLARRRDAYRARRSLGTSNPTEKIRPNRSADRERPTESEPAQELEPNQNQNQNQNQNENENQNGNENQNPNESQNLNPNEHRER